ncbi:MAG: PSD1 and planctomycete cytochrome C domain-containing protein [Phycisphaerales bacterium]|nr:PSD1 and planctomycete cytochrome C domain-containing protein [Phycisphaerales bacterium]
MADTIASMVMGMLQSLAVVISVSGVATASVDPESIRYGRDIRPILSDRCFLCHGPDENARMAGLRLDDYDFATMARKGGQAIVPGDPEASLVWQRITTTDPADIMPPPDSGKHQLTDEQIELVRQWIESGAPYENHWAFEPLVKPSVPETSKDTWSRNEIDRFVMQRVAGNGLQPNPDTDRATLARRVFLDLTGLPPTPDELDAFLADERPDAYERLIDRIFSEEPYRSRYAERMATPWMDLSRYGDTSGIHMDAGRSIWPWRDWVLRAYEENLPFDQFVVDQLAGDLVDNPTPDQIIASGFNRNHVTSDEGGAINDEYLLMYAIDRTNTVGSVFLGLTVGCAQCHDHKFDPISAEEYYGLLSFFNNNEEPGVYSQIPDPYRAMEPAYEILRAEDRARMDELNAYLGALLQERDTPTPDEAEGIAAFAAQLQAEGGWSWEQPAVGHTSSSHGSILKQQPDGSLLASGPVPDVDDYTITLSTESTGLQAILLEVMEDPSLPLGRVGRPPNGNAVMSGISAEVISKADPSQRRPLDITWAWADVEQPDGDFKVINTLRPDDGRVWALNGHQQSGKRVAMFTTREPFGYEGGSDVTVTLNFNSVYKQHSPGRVRLQLGRVNQSALDRLPTARTNWYIVGPYTTGTDQEHYDTAYGPEEAGPIQFGKKYRKQAWRHAPGVKEAENVRLAAGRGAEYVGCEIYVPSNRNMNVSLGSDDGLMVYHDGDLVLERRVNRSVGPDQDQLVLELHPGRNTLVCKVVNTGGVGGIYHREIIPGTTIPGDALAFVTPDLSDATRTRASASWRRTYSPRYLEAEQKARETEAELATITSGIPKTMVMKERAEVRPTYVMMRGAYDQPDMERPVTRSVPRILGELDVEGTADREDLARWLVGDENPITARVTVNRTWEMLFGQGLVETVEDFGYQGTWPTHPELLNWLAADFRDNGWDVQDLLRTILLSSTYRQASRANPDNAADPGNALYHHYPRQRLTAEQIRDQALYVSGLLVEKVGGPSVKPYQPDGLWQEVAMQQSNTRLFERGMGDELWRRSLYTYWKRAAPPPSMMALDAPTREYCSTRRITTNTPLQALVLWNDEQFVEAARVTAERLIRESDTDDERIDALFRRCTGSPPSPAIAEAVHETLAVYRDRYAVDSDGAAKLVAVGEAPMAEDLPAAELAAWTMLVNAVLASDAAIVKD